MIGNNFFDKYDLYVIWDQLDTDKLIYPMEFFDQ
jgi:hypothetical protein